MTNAAMNSHVYV